MCMENQQLHFFTSVKGEMSFVITVIPCVSWYLSFYSDNEM